MRLIANGNVRSAAEHWLQSWLVYVRIYTHTLQVFTSGSLSLYSFQGPQTVTARESLDRPLHAINFFQRNWLESFAAVISLLLRISYPLITPITLLHVRILYNYWQWLHPPLPTLPISLYCIWHYYSHNLTLLCWARIVRVFKACAWSDVGLLGDFELIKC